jgi:hypothetical protein
MVRPGPHVNGARNQSCKRCNHCSAFPSGAQTVLDFVLERKENSRLTSRREFVPSARPLPHGV